LTGCHPISGSPEIGKLKIRTSATADVRPRQRASKRSRPRVIAGWPLFTSCPTRNSKEPKLERISIALNHRAASGAGLVPATTSIELLSKNNRGGRDRPGPDRGREPSASTSIRSKNHVPVISDRFSVVMAVLVQANRVLAITHPRAEKRQVWPPLWAEFDALGERRRIEGRTKRVRESREVASLQVLSEGGVSNHVSFGLKRRAKGHGQSRIRAADDP